MRAARYSITSRFSVLALSGACAVGGCKSEPAEQAPAVLSEQPFEETVTWDEQTIGGIAARPQRPTPIKVGPAPLVYLAETPVMIQVIDQTANLILAEAFVATRTIVRIDERNGVMAGSESLHAGPLPPGHRYAIQIVPDGINTSRTGTYEPLPERHRGPKN